MQRTKEMTFAFLGGTVLGLTVGATLGLLYAPARGARTRRQIARQAERLGDRVEKVAERAREALEHGR